MTDPRPRSILLATDLSHRSDRALDRALQLARSWSARLVALTVVDAAPAPPATTATRAADEAAQRAAERRLRADIGASDPAVEIRVAHGDPVERILEVAAAEGCELIVLGVARHEALSRIVLGSTVDSLAARSTLPLLVVRQRAHAPYPRLLVASDFSPAAAHALRYAAAAFAPTPLWLFHAFTSPYPLLAGVSAARTHDDGLRMAQAAAEAHLQSAGLDPARRAELQLRLEHGDASLLLEDHGRAHPDDLLVLGMKAHNRLVKRLIGSRSQRILERAENDVLVLREPAAG